MYVLFCAVFVSIQFQNIDASGLETPMVLIPAGEFWQGCNKKADSDCEKDEKPGRTVRLSAFKIDKYEVTASRFADFLNREGNPKQKYFLENDYATIVKDNKTGKYRPRESFEKKPANNVSWFGADAYCKSLGKELPTEAQWEKAARGTDGRKFPWGNRGAHYYKLVYGTRFGLEKMAEIDAKEEGLSPYGLHHMAGNIVEWTADWYSTDYYENAPSKDPNGPAIGTMRILKGGSWYSDEIYVRPSYRHSASPEERDNRYGLRCALRQ